jgi:hypothetical protein
MVIILLSLLAVAVSFIVLLTYVLGFRLGGQSWFTEMHRVRAEAAAAQREMHSLTRAAFEAMAEEALRRRQPEK